MRDAQFSSKAYGTHDYKEITIDGRVQLDLLLALQRDHKLSSYSLNAVRSHFREDTTSYKHKLVTLRLPMCAPKARARRHISN